MKRTISLVIIIMAALIGALPVRAGYPPVRNFSRVDYGGGPQNWAMAQDRLGRMYIANTKGVLCYDSRRWELLHLPNYTTPRSLLMDTIAARLYVGGSGEMGWFCQEGNSGALSYHPIPLPDTTPVGEIWKIYQLGGDVWAQSDFCLLRHSGDRTIAIRSKEKIVASAVSGQTIFVALQSGALCRVSGMQFASLPGTGCVSGKRVVALLQNADGTMLIVTADHGLYTYDGVQALPLATPADEILKRNQVFCACREGELYMFGTVDCGAVVYDMKKGSLTYVNSSSGLINNTVLGAFFDRGGNLWLGLDDGLALAMVSSPISNMLAETTTYGAGYTSLLLGDRLLLGTNHGLYGMPYPPIPSPREPAYPQLVKGQVWAIDTIGSTLFVCDDNGLYCAPVSSPTSLRKVGGLPGALSVSPVGGRPDQPERVLVSTYDRFHLIERRGGEWHDCGPLGGYGDIGGTTVAEGNDYFWLSHWIKGVYRLHLDPEKRRFDRVTLYDTTNGLPASRNTVVRKIDGELIVSTEGGFYRFDPAAERFSPWEKGNKLFPSNKTATIFNTPGGDFWSVAHDCIWGARYSASGEVLLDTLSMRPLFNEVIAGRAHINFISERQMLVAGQGGFYEIDLSKTGNRKGASGVFVSRVTAGADSLVYRAWNSSGGSLSLPYSLNSLMFEFVMPGYESEESVEYSCLLENHDREWSNFGKQNVKEYTRLREGRYTLHVRARGRGIEGVSQASLVIEIAPPFYRHWIARTLYFLLIVCMIWAGFKYFMRLSRRKALAMERRKNIEMDILRKQKEAEMLVKDYEIKQLKAQQLEQEFKSKSEELSHVTLNLARKNQILTEISESLEKLKGEPEAVGGITRQISRIQKMIRENISHDDDWRNFARNFDVVYENFLKNLTTLHPSLTLSDQRICAYLRMGLSTKDIAPLLNISPRSVEMTRYRLRKKMGLPRETNLTDYLAKL